MSTRSDPIGQPRATAASEIDAWAASGAMALTGRAGGPPLGPPAGLVPRMEAIGQLLADRSAQLGDRLELDVMALLGERAAAAGLGRRGSVSCGGGTRLLRASDGWIAVSLARPEDVDLVPAWHERPAPTNDVWTAVTDAVAGMHADRLVERGVLLGLPVARLPQPHGPPASVAEQAPARAQPPQAIASPTTATHLFASLPLSARDLGRAPSTAALEGVTVVDMSSLWAGPLCGSLLQASGAEVVKVESIHRPDGARSGPPQLFDLLNAGKRSVALDLRSGAGRGHLAALLSAADVVIEASRPRALEQLGIDAEALVTGGGPRVWVSITGHGRDGAGRDRVAFGDDAAVAGGLVSWDDEGPCFCADAVADPTSGLVAATAALEALTEGGRWLIDVSLAGVAAHLAGPSLPAQGVAPAPPRMCRPRGRASALGQHTGEVLDQLVGAG